MSTYVREVQYAMTMSNEKFLIVILFVCAKSRKER